ncbi:MAG: hypothetical protein ACO1OK_10445 [Devosia sp.]
MKTLIRSISTLALIAELGGFAQAEEAAATWRLFVADHAQPVVHALADDGAVLATFSLDAPATLYRSATGDAVYAVQGSANRVTAIASGLAFEDHGDHADITLTTPSLSGFSVEGDYPVHFVEHDGQWAAFFDKEGIARVFDNAAALAGNAELREVQSGAPHHGVAIAFGAYDLVSAPHEQDPAKLPVGIRVLDRTGAQAAPLAPCPDLHGEASSGNLTAFACETGLLIASGGGDVPVITHLPYGEALPEGKVMTLLGGRGLQYFLGNYGPSAVVLIDPNATDAFRRIELPTRRVTFAVDPIRARFAYVFTEDGRLHRLDVVSGKVTASLTLTAPYSMDGNWSDPRPRIAVAGNRIVVTDPLNGRLLLVDAETFAAVGEIPVAGTPFNIVAVGGAGTRH